MLALLYCGFPSEDGGVKQDTTALEWGVGTIQKGNTLYTSIKYRVHAVQ